MAAAGAWMAVSASAAPLPGFTLAGETARISFYTRDNQKVDIKKNDQFLSRLESLLGTKVEGRVEYFRYSDAQQLAWGTGTYAAGLTLPEAGQVHSTEAFHAHEIVHVVAGRMGRPGTFFHEGLAVALGNGGKWNGEDVDKVAKTRAKGLRVSALVKAFETVDPNLGYALAGSFVQSLIEAHGIERVASFFKSCNGSNTEAAFAQAFGQSLDEAGAAWVASL